MFSAVQLCPKHTITNTYLYQRSRSFEKGAINILAQTDRQNLDLPNRSWRGCLANPQCIITALFAGAKK